MKFACNMPTESSPLRVLVVDGEPLIRWSLFEPLGDRRDVVTEAGSAVRKQCARSRSVPHFRGTEFAVWNVYGRAR
jgi:hypothetical protein